MVYDWLLDVLRQEYDLMHVVKDTPRSSIRLLRHRKTGKKFILRQFHGCPDVYDQLLRISCANLPDVYEVAAKDGETLVLEEYIEGDTLGRLLQGALFSVRETQDIVTQVCQALWVLSMGAVHRDIKPENIILRRRDAILIDFDAARIHKPAVETDTQILGTVGFAAPEQYGISQFDLRADIYSLGVLINVMLTGEHPSRALAPGRMGRIVERCTRVNPAKRYKNVLRLMEAF